MSGMTRSLAAACPHRMCRRWARCGAAVLEQHADLGLATDGDADRLGIIDDEGRFVHPNQILVLLYYYLLKYKGWHGPAVRNLATTHLLDRVAAAFGENLL